MISKKQRLSYSDFSFRKYSVLRTSYFSVKIAPNNLSFHRIGAVISSAAVKSAVMRNFWRRQVIAALDIIPGKPKDVMVIFNNRVRDLTKSAFRLELKKIMS